ncbi:MAG: UbiD family decarboxylase [Thermodesulfobacteriota bacterium]
MSKRRAIKPDNHDHWPFLSLRDFLAFLDQNDRLLHVEKEVDAKLEIGGISRRLLEEGSDKAAIFWNTTSSAEGWHVEPPHEVLVEGVHRHMRMFEDIFNVSKKDIYKNWFEKVRKPIEPVVVKDGPCQEVILEGDDVDLQKIPIEWCGSRQGGPFISLGCCFLKHPDTGVINGGVYRLHAKSRNHTGILIVPHQHSAVIYAKYDLLKQHMPMAVAIGTDPLLPIVCAAPFPVSYSELAGWGAVQGRPMEMVKCKTLDLLVPAQAEYILEGEVLRDVREMEGPFGEYTGFYSGVRDLPVFKVHCVTHRKDPIYNTVTIGKPPSEGNTLTEMGFGLELARGVREYLPEVTGVRSMMTHGLVTVIQIDKQRRYKGIAMRAGNMVWTMKSHVKQVFVVDDDIDIWNNDDILWAFATRCQAHKDVVIIPNVSGVRLDPSEPHGGEEGLSCKMIMDCTEPFPPLHAPYMRGQAVPDPATVEKVAKKWSEYFPDRK